MKLKTYTAQTMAQALAQVRKDLGSDAMILHTRSYRTGSWLGLGGKPMVEITASSPQPTKSRKPRRAKQTPAPRPTTRQDPMVQPNEEPVPEIVVQRSHIVHPVHAQATQVHTNPQALIRDDREATPSQIDDRAALLHGLMGDSISPIRDRRVESESRRNESPPAEAPAEHDEPDDVQFSGEGFELTTFERYEHSDEMIDDRTDQEEDQSSFPTQDENTPGPLLTESDEPVFEHAIEPESEASPHAQSTTGASTPARVQSVEDSALQSQIESLQRMMGQVLDSTRRTAVAVNKSSADGSLPPVSMPAPLHALYIEMIDNDVPVDLADRFVGSVRDRLDSDELGDGSVVRHALLREIESSIETTSESFISSSVQNDRGDRPRVIALIGPTGVGKTTTVAKLAATAKLRHGKRVALITSDTYRIAAVEQLKTYASIIGLEILIANTPDEMSSVIQTLRDVDLVVIDTAGRSQNNNARLDELGQLIEAAAPDETHLVLSSTVGDNVLRKTAERFGDLGPDRCILTKIDEAVTTGMIAGMSDRIGLPMSYITVGQEVPDDILPARADRLARAVLDGPSAVVRGC